MVLNPCAFWPVIVTSVSVIQIALAMLSVRVSTHVTTTLSMAIENKVPSQYINQRRNKSLVRSKTRQRMKKGAMPSNMAMAIW